MTSKLTQHQLPEHARTAFTVPECDLRGNFLSFWAGDKQVNRKTEQKLAVLRALYTSKQHHLTAEELYKLVKRQIPTISETTVYRTLKRLVDEGLAVRRQLLPDLTHYERVREAHAHVVCTVCGQVEDVPAFTALKSAKENRIQDFKITHTDIIYHGVCKSCRQG